MASVPQPPLPPASSGTVQKAERGLIDLIAERYKQGAQPAQPDALAATGQPGATYERIVARLERISSEVAQLAEELSEYDPSLVGYLQPIIVAGRKLVDALNRAQLAREGYRFEQEQPTPAEPNVR